VSRVTSPEFIGRETEREVLTDALDAARAGRPALIVVAGEAGVGKTRLVQEIVRSGRADGTAVMLGSAVDLGGDQLAFGPLTEALRSFVRTLSPAQRDDLLEPIAGDLVPILPELAPRGPGSGTNAPYPARPIDGFVDAVRRIASTSPLLLVVEDVHWADGSTRNALSVLARSLRNVPVLVLLTHRTDELQRRHRVLPWLTELLRIAGVGRIDLEPLERHQIRELIVSIVGAQPPRSLVDEIFERSDGNPFFAEELLVGRGTRSPDQHVPRVVSDGVRVRVAALSPETQRVLGVASVLGRRVDHALLLATTEVPEAELEGAVREAVVAHVLIPEDDGTYTFRHALAREAIYEGLLPSERRRYHARAAVVLSKSDPREGTEDAGRLGLIAHHWDRAGDPRLALPAALAAADAAERSFGFPVAALQYERAIELWGLVREPERPMSVTEAELWLSAAEAHHIAGEFAHAASLADGAVALFEAAADPRGLGRALYAAGRIRWHLHDQRRSVDAFERAVGVLHEDGGPDLPTIQAALALQLVRAGRIERALRVADDAIAGARRLGLRPVEGRALRAKGVARSFRGDPEPGLRLINEALAIARESNDATDIGEASWELGTALVRAGRSEEALAFWRAASDEARHNGTWRLFGMLYDLGITTELVFLGRWTEAAEALASLEPDAGAGIMRDVHLGNSAKLAARRGSVIGTEDQAGLRRAIEAASSQYASYGAAALVEVELARGSTRGAWQVVQLGLRAGRDAEPVVASTELLQLATRVAAEVMADARARSDTDTLVAFAERVEELDERVEAVRRHPVIRIARVAAFMLAAKAELAGARGTPDPGMWSEAERAYAAADLPYEAAYSAFRLAETLAETTGVRESAAAPLRRAFEAASRLGAEPVVALSVRLAGRTRVGLREKAKAEAAPATSDADPLSHYRLSRREREVLALVAAGHTNREIARELYITPSTAGVHVSNVIAKLGVTNRVQAAALASRVGVSPDR
jgi:DNA-binding CsgD family transcriptional regulator